MGADARAGAELALSGAPYTRRVDGPKLAIIVAIGRNGVIGRRGGLPWDLPEDRAHFHATTRGHVVIMGRRTWEETGVALPERTNVVVSSALATHDAPNATIVSSLNEALAFAWLAQQTVDGKPGNVPAVTGARGLRVLGAIYPR